MEFEAFKEEIFKPRLPWRARSSVCVTLGEFRSEILGLLQKELSHWHPELSGTAQERRLSFDPPALRNCQPCQGSVREHKVPLPWVQTQDPRTGSSKQWRIQQLQLLDRLCCRHRERQNSVHRIPKPGWQLHPVQFINLFICHFHVRDGNPTLTIPGRTHSSNTPTPSSLQTRQVFNIFTPICSSYFVRETKAVLKLEKLKGWAKAEVKQPPKEGCSCGNGRAANACPFPLSQFTAASEPSLKVNIIQEQRVWLMHLWKGSLSGLSLSENYYCAAIHLCTKQHSLHRI